MDGIDRVLDEKTKCPLASALCRSIMRLLRAGLVARSAPRRGSCIRSVRSRRLATMVAGPPTAAAEGEDCYRKPPAAISSFVERPETPGITLSPRRDAMLYLHRPSSYTPVSELARPELKLAGIRFDAEQNTRSRMGYNTALAVAPLRLGEPPGPPRFITGIPAGTWLNYVSWSPSGGHIAFTVRGSGEAGNAR